jgi:hypothetical protein
MFSMFVQFANGISEVAISLDRPPGNSINSSRARTAIVTITRANGQKMGKPLGLVRVMGGCWVNENPGVRICAWPLHEHPKQPEPTTN